MKWWKTEYNDELPAYIRKLEDDVEQLETLVVQLKETPEGRKNQIIFDFFTSCKSVITGEEPALMALKFAGYSCDEICRIARKLVLSKSTVHRKIQAASAKLLNSPKMKSEQ